MTYPIHRDPVKNKLNRQALMVAVVTSVILTLAKIIAWMASDSVAVLSSLMDSVLDVGSALLIYWALRTAKNPPDKEHRFGHAKAESIAALLQGAFIAGSALMVLVEAAHRLVEPEIVHHEDFAASIMMGALVVLVLLVVYQQYVVHQTQSLAVKANLLNYKMDILITLAVVGSLVASSLTTFKFLDPVVALLIVIYLVKASYDIINKAIHELMDGEIAPDQRQVIEDIIHGHPQVVDFHDLRTRFAGSDAFIEMHIELDGSLPLEEVHVVTDDLEEELEALFPGCFVIIHPEPAGIDDKRDTF